MAQPAKKWPVSPKQVKFINDLMVERVGGTVYVGTQLAANKVAKVEELSSTEAKHIIGVLLHEPKAKSAEKAAAPSLAEGYYHDGEEDKVYKVVVAKSTGNKYAKVLVPPAQGKKKGSWVYAPGAMKRATGWVKLDKESAAALGKKWGICAICGAHLSDDTKKYKDGLTSIERGIGPVCAGVV